MRPQHCGWCRVRCLCRLTSAAGGPAALHTGLGVATSRLRLTASRSIIDHRSVLGRVPVVGQQVQVLLFFDCPGS